jgi:hypothetical protein
MMDSPILSSTVEPESASANERGPTRGGAGDAGPADAVDCVGGPLWPENPEAAPTGAAGVRGGACGVLACGGSSGAVADGSPVQLHARRGRAQANVRSRLRSLWLYTAFPQHCERLLTELERA